MSALWVALGSEAIAQNDISMATHCITVPTIIRFHNEDGIYIFVQQYAQSVGWGERCTKDIKCAGFGIH